MTGTERRAVRGMTVGSASMVMIFAVLALTVFAVLTLVTARSELALSEKSAQAVREYYEADCIAAEMYNEFLMDGLPGGAERYSFTVPMGSSRELCVTLCADEFGGPNVLEWRTVPAGEWMPDDSLDVWIPE